MTANPLELEKSATEAFLAGKSAESEAHWTRAHEQYLNDGNVAKAARSAFWVGMLAMDTGNFSRGQGWFARAQRLLDEAQLDCAERGYLLLPIGLRAAIGGDAPAAYAAFSDAAEIGKRFVDRDLLTLARHGQGRALIYMGRIEEGVSLLDEAMVAITAGEVTPLIVGDLYCSVIEACSEIFDLRRAHEWTESLARWCASRPALVAFRGNCLVRRAEVMQLHGAWPTAIDETERACECLLQPPPRRAVGRAYYQRGELHRLRGDLAQADEDYKRASEWGATPQPGLARLRLAQGRGEAALTMIRQAYDASKGRPNRAIVLGAYADIMLAANEVAAARAAADELNGIAEKIDAPFLRALAGYAAGSALHAEGDSNAAIAVLREACMTWQELEAPYEVARTRLQIAVALRGLGDTESAAFEIDAARQGFTQLGAASDLAAIERLTADDRMTSPTGGLSAREVEVLRLVATGKTNRAIAAALRISEKTVARHVSNIFTKLGLASRAAATAYAYENKLLTP